MQLGKKATEFQVDHKSTWISSCINVCVYKIEYQQEQSEVHLYPDVQSFSCASAINTDENIRIKPFSSP